MGLSLKEKKPLIREQSKLYKKATKKQKTIILDNFIKLTQYNRSYARTVLRNYGKIVFHKNKKIIATNNYSRKSGRKKYYDEPAKLKLIEIWYIMDCICSKRFKQILSEIIDILERFDEIQIDSIVKQKLNKISISTIDRLLKSERTKFKLKGKRHTKPGTLLKNQIPVRTFADWDDLKPGFLEIDLVAHDGGNMKGDFIYSFNSTDVSTGWTEVEAIKNKARKWSFQGLINIKGRLPFDLLGIDSDNGGEFINDHFVNFCNQNKITFTRSRSYRKNDNCFVEQKNYSVVRRAVGYSRYDTDEQLNILNELYSYLRLYINFFQPVMKLISKTRNGNKVSKKYDKAKTPYQRLLLSDKISDTVKNKLKKLYKTLNPAMLKRKITEMQYKLK